MYVVVSNNETFMYNLSCVVCLKCFLLVDVYCISYGGFQIKVIQFVGGIVLARLKK
jgi:hypothetical protein